MRLFLDTSVLLAAAGSAKGASRFVIRTAAAQGWELVSSDYCAEEVRRNLPKVGPVAMRAWRRIASRVCLVRTDVALDRPLVFPKAKDRPVVITALAARSEWLLTLDEGDFHAKLGREVCVRSGGSYRKRRGGGNRATTSLCSTPFRTTSPGPATPLRPNLRRTARQFTSGRSKLERP